MGGGSLWFELHHLLLLWAHQPSFSEGLLQWFVGGAVTGQGGEVTATEDCSAYRSCQSDSPAAQWRIRCLGGGLYRAGACSGLKDAGESTAHR